MIEYLLAMVIALLFMILWETGLDASRKRLEAQGQHYQLNDIETLLRAIVSDLDGIRNDLSAPMWTNDDQIDLAQVDWNEYEEEYYADPPF